MHQRQSAAIEPQPQAMRRRQTAPPEPQSPDALIRRPQFRVPRRPPRAQTPVPGLYPAGTVAAPADNSRTYKNHRRSAASARTNAPKQTPSPSPRYTERPAELQFMVRRVVLHNDVTYTLYCPDSKRPKRRGVGLRARSGVEAAQPPLWALFRGWPSGRVRFTRRFVSVHACCLSFDKQDGLRDVAFLFRRVEIAIRAFS